MHNQIISFQSGVNVRRNGFVMYGTKIQNAFNVDILNTELHKTLRAGKIAPSYGIVFSN